jgi:hypothetical protein
VLVPRSKWDREVNLVPIWCMDLVSLLNRDNGYIYLCAIMSSSPLYLTALRTNVLACHPVTLNRDIWNVYYTVGLRALPDRVS